MANCREYCPHKEICRKYYPKCQGEEKLSHSECPIAWKIEDILMDTKDMFKDPDDYEEQEEE